MIGKYMDVNGIVYEGKSSYGKITKKIKEIQTLEKKIIMMMPIEGFTCLDVGFSRGWFTRHFLQKIGKLGKVYSWEPNKILFENYLKKWKFKNLIGYNYALSDKTGLQKYYIYSHEGLLSGYNSLEPNQFKEKYKTVEEVKTKSLDDWWGEANKCKVDLIKIDCEGHDYKILLGGKKMIQESKPRFIWIESDDKNVCKFMENENYDKNNKFNELGLADTIWEKL